MMMTTDLSSSRNCRKTSYSSWFDIFDQRSEFIKKCNYSLLFISIFNHYVDALFVYIATLNNLGAMSADMQLGLFISFLRLFGDFSLFLSMILKFRTAISYEDPTFHKLSGNKELVREPRIIAMNYLKSTFIFHFLASLPLPEVYIWYCIVVYKTFQAVDVYYYVNWIVSLQSVPRFIVTVIVYRKIEKVYGIVIRNPWAGTLYILFVYAMFSHLLGAIFYLIYIDGLLYCRDLSFLTEANATMHDLDQLVANCTQKNESEAGLVVDAYANTIGSRSFAQKYMFCFSWGLKTLSSMGQNLTPNASVLDSITNILIVIIGLVVFADLIAHMQTCMQSVDEPEQQQMIRHRVLEEWTNVHQLPPNLKRRIREAAQIHFDGTRNADVEAMLDSLPNNLSCDIRRHLYLERVRNLPVFREMDDQFMHAICGHLRTFTGNGGMFIALEGDPVQLLLFIFTGQLEIFSVDSQSSSCLTVGPGGLCGQELLAWSSLPGSSTTSLPSSTCTVKCLTDVEGFSLLAKDLKLIAIELNYDQKLFDALLRHPSKDRELEIYCCRRCMGPCSC